MCSSRKSTRSEMELVTHSLRWRDIRVPTVSKNSRMSCLESLSLAGAKCTHLDLFLRNTSASSGSQLKHKLTRKLNRSKSKIVATLQWKRVSAYKHYKTIFPGCRIYVEREIAAKSPRFSFESMF